MSVFEEAAVSTSVSGFSSTLKLSVSETAYVYSLLFNSCCFLRSGILKPFLLMSSVVMVVGSDTRPKEGRGGGYKIRERCNFVFQSRTLMHSGSDMRDRFVHH